MTADKELLARLRGLRNEHAEGTEIHEAFDAAIQRIEQGGRDAERMEYVVGISRATSLDMGGNHRWATMYPNNARGPSLRAAIDAALAEKGAGK